MMNDIPVCERPANMMERFAEIKTATDDISCAIRRFDAFLYGDTAQNTCEKEPQQLSSFESAVELYQKNLFETREMLFSIMSRFGVQ